MSISNKIDQKERRAVLASDQQSKLRPGEHEPSTMFQMANLDTGVTPSRVGKSYVSGSEQAVQYEAIPSGPWSSDYARLADEPPLGYPIDAQEPVGTFAEVQVSLSAAGASAEAGKAEVAAPTLVDHPTANVVERTSATSLISSASAERDQAPEMRTGGAASYNGRQSHPTLHRPTRRL
jgi:Zn-dependent M28 family amino/carboxypeptidase